jgi:hypothetical protein
MSYRASALPGNDKFKQHMQQMEMNFAAEVIGGFIDIALQFVEDKSRSSAPVQRGTLRDSISHYMTSLLAGECIVAVPYALPVEYGYMSRGGRRVPGRNFFRPAALDGFNMLKDMLKKFIGDNVKGPAATPGHKATVGGGGRPHKYLYKVTTGSGTKYYYSPGTQTRFTTPLKRGPGKSQPSFGKIRGGRLPRRF